MVQNQIKQPFFIDHHTFSQRIYEGLAYGCIVLSNSLPACEQTNNIVVYVDSLKDLEEKMTYYKNNPDLIKQKQEQGYAFVKKHGTNEKSVELISNVIHKFLPEWEL
jgi:spore maturation protein CgeB